MMKTIRLLYPDHVSGGLDTYYFGANLLSHILPQNPDQPQFRVKISPPDKKEYETTDGIYAKKEVFEGIKNALNILKQEAPDKVITIGGNCIVSLAPFDYLRGKYNEIGIVWIDSHPDISSEKSDYTFAHAKVLSALLGKGSPKLSSLMKNEPFSANQILYVGLQDLHDYQEEFLKDINIDFKVQTNEFLSNEKIRDFVKEHKNILIHLDIDVLDPNLFHSTYFANKELIGDGSSGGKMTLDELENILNVISVNSNIVGFTIAEYLPFDEYKLHQLFSRLSLFTNK